MSVEPKYHGPEYTMQELIEINAQIVRDRVAKLEKAEGTEVYLTEIRGLLQEMVRVEIRKWLEESAKTMKEIEERRR